MYPFPSKCVKINLFNDPLEFLKCNFLILDSGEHYKLKNQAARPKLIKSKVVSQR